ncbi:FkbM family methyltransferase [Ovoidimarina sediminis]|uniref:FkbM family methyltransferase n=1 Tax=Ovoidimarina sediminis TaxID=3079856 RepID=UPI00291440CA|nr:FkbM family methyltransferase [Rhodophyticola sp. MJ-SS7]MDU8944073.1 FkbM family methyltransferase [Rhodophyticola sp. MJ-SS7]
MSKVRRFVRKAATPLLGDPATPLSTALQALKGLDFAPSTVVDVGANKGQWTRSCRRFFPEARYVLFEPQEALKPHFSDLLATGQVELHSIGLGREPGEAAFTLHERDDSRTFALSAEVAERRGFEQVTLKVDALDRFLSENGLPDPEILKVDAEGWDLEVLDGAARVLETAEVVFVEAAVANRRIQTDLLSVLKYMDARGYTLLDLSDLNRPFAHGLLWLVEGMFVRRGGLVDQAVEAHSALP